MKEQGIPAALEPSWSQSSSQTCCPRLRGSESIPVTVLLAEEGQRSLPGALMHSLLKTNAPVSSSCSSYASTSSWAGRATAAGPARVPSFCPWRRCGGYGVGRQRAGVPLTLIPASSNTTSSGPASTFSHLDRPSQARTPYPILSCDSDTLHITLHTAARDS